MDRDVKRLSAESGFLFKHIFFFHSVSITIPPLLLLFINLSCIFGMRFSRRIILNNINKMIWAKVTTIKMEDSRGERAHNVPQCTEYRIIVVVTIHLSHCFIDRIVCIVVDLSLLFVFVLFGVGGAQFNHFNLFQNVDIFVVKNIRHRLVQNKWTS